MKKSEILYSHIYWVDFQPSMGHEFKGRRPALVIQSNTQTQKSNLITVIPLTSQVGNKLHHDIFIKSTSKNRLRTNSILKVFQIASFDTSRFIKEIGVVSAPIMEKIKKYLRIHFEL